MEKVDWKIEGMTCSNCALTISKFLQKKGAEDIKVNPIDGALSFKSNGTATLPSLRSGIETLGYKVTDSTSGKTKGSFLSNNKKRFLFTLPFTLVLMLHMLDKWIHVHWIMDPWVQLLLCLPVFATGMWYFGRSAAKSIRNGMPNMNVLITLGALASFTYSLTGAILHLGEQYLFFETTASII